MTTALLPNGKQTFYDANGVPLVGGSVAFYVPSTFVPKNTWKDSDFSLLNTNPVVLDQLGSAVIFGSGTYRQIVKDSDNNTIWDEETSVNTSVDIGFNGFIVDAPASPVVPVIGLSITLPAATAVINGVFLPFEQIIVTIADNSIVDCWLNANGTYTIETQSVATYINLPHYSDKLHIWKLSSLSGNIISITLMSNTYPTVARPNDIAGTIDTFAETFYLYPTTTNWSASLAVTYGELLLTSAGKVYQVFFPGTTGGSAPTSTATGAITDGSAILFYYCQSSYLGMFRYAPNNGIEYYFTNLGLEQVCHKTLLTGSPLGEPAGTTMMSMVKGDIQGVFTHVIGNRVDLGTYVYGMKIIAGGYIWLNTTVAGGTTAGTSPFSGSYTPGSSTIVDGTITWLCIYTSYASQQWFWMNVDRTFLIYRSPDSHDSYASTFASLLARYVELTNDYSWMTGNSPQPSGAGTYWTYQEVFGYIINQNLDTQISNFLTKTFQYDINPLDGSAFATQYLEDNCESVKGYRNAAYIYGVLGDTVRQAAALANVPYIGAGVANLYNTTYNLYATNYGQDVSTWANNNNIAWYPYLQAQFWPELCTVGTINDDQFKLVRYNVSLRWNNYYDDKALDLFPNNFLGFMAAKAWQDTKKAYDFVEKTERYFVSGGSVAQGKLTPASATTIAEWGMYLGTKDALIPPLTVLNITGNNLNLLNQTGNIVPFVGGIATGTLGALVYPTSAQAITDSVPNALTYDSFEYNNGGIWAIGNPTRLTCPFNGYVRLTGEVGYESMTSDGAIFVLTIYKNGSNNFYGRPKMNAVSGPNAEVVKISICSAIIPVVAGDYFELITSQNTGGTLNTDYIFDNYQTWFSLEYTQYFN